MSTSFRLTKTETEPISGNCSLPNDIFTEKRTKSAICVIRILFLAHRVHLKGACQYFCMLGIVGCRLLVVVHHVEGLLTTDISLFSLLSTDPPRSLCVLTDQWSVSWVISPKDHHSPSWVLPLPIHVRTNRPTVILLLARVASTTRVRTSSRRDCCWVPGDTKETIHIISLQPISKKQAPKSIH